MMPNHIQHSGRVVVYHNPLQYSLVSSAKLTSLDADTSLSISEIMIKNRRGPKTVPCGTPLNTGWSSLIPPGNCTK